MADAGENQIASGCAIDRADEGRLAAIRQIDIIIAIGRDDGMRPGNEEFSRRLESKGIWHALRIWDGWAHDWPYWRQMIVKYIGGHD